MQKVALDWDRYVRIREFVYRQLGVDHNLGLSRVAQGRAIDTPKGVRPPTEEEIRAFAISWNPVWLRQGDPNAHTTDSPLSNVYAMIHGGDYWEQDDSLVENYKGLWAEMKSREPEVSLDRTWLIMEQIDPEELAQVLPDVEEIEKQWRADLAALSKARESKINERGGENITKHDLDEVESWWKMEFAELRQQYVAIMADLPYSEETKAAAAYYIAYTRHVNGTARSVSFPWTVCAPGLISLVSKIGERTQLVPIKEVRALPGEKVKVEGGIVYDMAGNVVGKANLQNGGEYPTFGYDGRWFVKVPNRRPVDTGVGNVSFRLVGLAQFGVTTSQVWDLIQAAGGYVTVAPIANRKGNGYSLGVIVGAQEVGFVAKEDLARIRPCAVRVDLAQSSVPKGGYIPQEAKSLKLVGQRVTATAQVDRNKVLTRVNRTASYWQDTKAIRKMEEFGILRATIRWERNALPHVNKLGLGSQVATVQLQMPDGKIVNLRVGVSPAGEDGQPLVQAGNGKAELVIMDELPTHVDFKEPVRRQFVNSVLAWVNWEHAVMWVRWQSARLVANQQAQ